jgi:hypothetical protein
MIEMKLIELSSDHRLVEVKPELWSKGWVYITEDCRRTVLIVSQRLHLIAETIDRLCNQFVSISSLSESATCRRKGRTAGAWKVRRVSYADVPSVLQELRPRYSQVFIAAINPGVWKLMRSEVTQNIESNCQREVSTVNQDQDE